MTFGVACALLALGALLTACGDRGQGPARSADAAPAAAGDAPAPPVLVRPPVPEEPQVDVAAPVAVPPDAEKLRAAQAQWRRDMDEFGRGLIDSFRRRAFDPVRDADLRHAEGVAQVRGGDAAGAFRITFDVSRPVGERVALVPEGDVAALPKGTAKQVRAFAAIALNGPYRHVVAYLPPIELLLTYSKDRKYKIVTAPPHKHDVQVSYRFDERELISHRGISVRPAAEITRYEWTFWRGRYLLSEFWVHGTGATCEFEYDDRDTSGVVLLRRAHLQKAEKSFDVAFTWERVEVGTPAPGAAPAADDATEAPARER